MTYVLSCALWYFSAVSLVFLAFFLGTVNS